MRTNATSRSILGLWLLIIAGCDAPRGTPEQPPAASAGPTPAATATDAPGIVRDYGKCYVACLDEKTSDTNRETCKLNCQSVAEAAPATDLVTKSLATLHGCIDLCAEDAKLSPTNRETCILTCQDAAEVGVSAAPSATPPK